MPGDLVDDRYKLVRSLGRGGFGEVHLAIDQTDGREVAIKILERASSNREQLKRRLQREARATQVLDETRVARAERVGETPGGQLYVVMPFVIGETVRERMQRGLMETEEALRVLREVAVTLDSAHAAGLIHRDVKPDNVMLAADGRVVLLDFGIVKALADTSEPGGAAFASTQLTGNGALLGTVAYVAPEQALGNEIDPRADQFGLGVMAFELLTGRLPWAGELPARVLAQVLYQPAPRAAPLRLGLFDAVDPTLARALAKSPDARFSSAGAFIDALTRAVRSGTAPPVSSFAVSVEAPISAAMSAPPAPEPVVSERRGWKAGALALLVMGALGAAALVVRERSHTPVKWASGARGILAVPLASLDPHAPCPEWLSGALAEGLTSQLAAGGNARTLGPRDLGTLAHANLSNRSGLRGAFGVDALLQISCASASPDGSASVQATVVSANDDGRQLASVEVTGSPRAPSDLVARLADKLRDRLGIAPPDAVERARADRSLPQDPEAARAYVEGLAKLQSFDANGARAAFERVVSLDSQFAPAHAALASAFSWLGDQTNAARESKIAAAQASSLPNEDRLIVEADADASNGAWEKAADTYRAIVKVFPDRTDVALKLIRIQIDAGRSIDAEATIADLLDRTGGDTGDPRVYVESARTALLVGENARADTLAVKAESVANGVGLTNVALQAEAVRCKSMSELSEDAGAGTVCAKADQGLTAAGDAMGALRVRQSWSWILVQTGNIPEAQRLVDGMLDLAKQLGSSDALSAAYAARLFIAKRQGDVAAARENGRLAIEAADESGRAGSRVATRITLAGVLLDHGALDEGHAYYEEALTLARKVGADSSVEVILQNLAIYYERRGSMTLARENADEALALCERLGNEIDRPWALDQVGIIALEMNDPVKARDRFSEAQALRRKLGLPEGASLQNHAESLLMLGELDDALKEATEAVEGFRRAGLRVGEGYGRALLARVLLSRGEWNEAQEASELGARLSGSDEGFAAAHFRAMFLAGKRGAAMAGLAAVLAKTDRDPTERWDLRLVQDELKLRSGEGRDAALRDLRALSDEAHTGGDARCEHMAAALLAGKLDGGYR